MWVDIFSRSHRGDAGFRLPWAAFLFCGAAAAAVLSRLPRGEATLAADDDRRAVVCAEPVSVDLLGLDHRLAGRGGVHHEPVDAVCAAHRMGDDENTPGPGILGVPAGRDRRPRAAESAYADCLPPQPGLVSADRAGAVDLVLLHQPLRPRCAPDPR
ncbi:Uncharacterised protein [Raoultella ornithinolytica]|nr:Uncharacterised protein [Raoultella ornithinolytica]